MELINIPYMDVTYKEVFNMKFLYTVIREWLMLNEYSDAVGDVDLRFVEVYYLEKRANVKEIRAWWRATKKPQGSSFFRYRIRIDMRVISMVDVEIIRNGKKMKAQDGEITIEIHPQLQVDYDDKWHNHPILKHFLHLFTARVYHHQINDQRRLLYREAYRLQGFLKKYLELKTFVPEIEVFHERFDRL